MKILVQISRILVGFLFIISGLIKLNDPLGFSYKLQEYFSTDVLNLPFLEPYALAIAIILVILEVILGVFLLIGYYPKFTFWSLLILILFFTFLTFYSAYFDKVKDCGCFGDALKLTPWESFTKDLILLLLIGVIGLGLKFIKPIFNKLTTTLLALGSFIICLFIAYQVLMHLPYIDFRAYKIGDNIKNNMSIPPNAPKTINDWVWTFNVNGEEKKYTNRGSYPEVEGEFVKYETIEIQKGYEPPILDFSVSNQDEDITSLFLDESKIVVFVLYNINSSEKPGIDKMKSLAIKAIASGYKVAALTASGYQDINALKESHGLNFPFYLTDEKVLKTIVRANPGVVVMQNATVIDKKHWNDFDEISLN